MSKGAESLGDSIAMLIKELSCPICFELLDDPCAIGCAHYFCHDCLSKSLSSKNQCPVCKRPGSREIEKNPRLDTIAKIARQIEAASMDFSAPSPKKRAGKNNMHSTLDHEIATIQGQLTENMDALQRVSKAIAEIRDLEVEQSHLKPDVQIPKQQQQQRQIKSSSMVGGTSPDKSSSKAAPSLPPPPSRSTSPPPPPLLPRAKSSRQSKRPAPSHDPFSFPSSADVDSIPPPPPPRRPPPPPRHQRDPSPSLPHFSDEDNDSLPPPKLMRRSSSVSTQELEERHSASDAPRSQSSLVGVRRKPLILLTGFGQPNPMEQEMTNAISMLGGKVATSWTPRVTHVLLPKRERAVRTLKYLLGVASGAWIVCKEFHQGLDASVASSEWVSEDPYEVQSDSYASGAPQFFRKRVAAGQPGLFHSQKFLLWGAFKPPAPDKNLLKRLIEMAGGVVVTRIGNDVKVICEPLLPAYERRKLLKLTELPLKSDYILDCISFCSLEPQEHHCLLAEDEDDGLE